MLDSAPPAPGQREGLSFLEALNRRFQGLPADRQAFAERFLVHGLPTHRDEEWKYTSLRLLSETKFADSPAGEPDAAQLEGLPELGNGPRLVFWNGRLSLALSSFDQIPDGLAIRRLEGEERPARFGAIAQLEGKLGSTNDERFVWLNAALFDDGAWISIEPGAVLEEPIALVFLSGGQTAPLSFPRVFIEAGAGSQAKVVEVHVGHGVYASIGVAEASVAANAILEHVRIQDDSPEAFHLATLSVEQANDSTYTSTSVQFGARIGRIDANVWVGGEHAETWLNGAYVGRDEQHLDNHTRIDHAVPNCHSFEVYKGILGDRSSGVFNGKIFVYPDAQKTDAKQTNQALLLTSTATVDTKPQLEIFADDVKCTHGATVGQLREEALFYLRSRGIPAEEARNLLVYAFVAEVLEKVSLPALAEALEARLFEKLSTAGSR